MIDLLSRAGTEADSDIQAIAQEMEVDFTFHFRLRDAGGVNFHEDDAQLFADWLQQWLRQRFPDLAEYPRFVAQIHPQDQRVLGFPGLAKSLPSLRSLLPGGRHLSTLQTYGEAGKSTPMPAAYSRI